MDDNKKTILNLEILVRQMAEQMKTGRQTAEAIKNLPAVNFDLVIKKLDEVADRLDKEFPKFPEINIPEIDLSDIKNTIGEIKKILQKQEKPDLKELTVISSLLNKLIGAVNDQKKDNLLDKIKIEIQDIFNKGIIDKKFEISESQFKEIIKILKQIEDKEQIYPDVQPISGEVFIKNFPQTQDIGGMVTVENMPTTQDVRIVEGDIEIGSVEIKNATDDTRAAVTVRGSKGALGVEILDASGNQITSFGSSVVGITGPVSVTGTVSVTEPLGVTGTFWQTTQQVSVTGSINIDEPLGVTGTFWQATQPVSGTFYQATQPVSAVALPLPSGAATETTLALIETNTEFFKDIDSILSYDGSGNLTQIVETDGVKTKTTVLTYTSGNLTGVAVTIT